MGLFDQLKGMITGKTYSDIDFEKKLKEIDKDRKCDKERRKLEMAYAHNSVDSAFWWYEHMPVKPNTGSMRDVEMLHAKYKCSVERITGVPYEKGQKLQNDFLRLVLPDINYAARGFKDKDECIKSMLFFVRFLHKEQSHNAIKSSPFMSPEYWLLFNTDDNSIADGKMSRKADGKFDFDDELTSAYSSWLREFMTRVANKYHIFSLSEMQMPE